MKTPSIHQLRIQGYKVRVIHITPLDVYGGGLPYQNEVPHVRPENIKHITRIEVTTPDGQNTHGTAFCYVGDSYNRKLGNQIALGRALKKLR